jgi:hypothetical protein
MRPDLPKPLLAAVARALDVNPAGRPDAASLAGSLRLAGRKRKRRRGRGQTLTLPATVPRLVPVALATAFTLWASLALPFYPTGWPFGLAALAAGATFWRPRLGLAFALLVPVLPLGNYALGAAVLYVAVATALLVVWWRESQYGFLFVLGPLLAPIAALGLLPLAALAVRSPVRRGVLVAAGVLAAGIAAGVRGASLPFDGSAAPDLGAAANGDPFAVTAALWHALTASPALGVEALVLAAVAVLLPYTRARGLWAVALLGAAFLAAALLAVPTVAAAPLVAAVWATCLAVALASARKAV